MAWARSVPGFAAALLFLSGCVSGTPRRYAPVIQPPVVDQAAFERDFAACSTAVAEGERDFTHSKSAVVVGTVGGVAAAQTLGGAAAATAVGGSTALAATGVGLILLVPFATYSLSKSRRDRNEREIQGAMTACLAQKGHSVAAWTRVSRKDAASPVATPTKQARPSR